MHSFIERRMPLGFSLVVILTLFIVGALFQVSVRQKELNHWVEHTHQVQIQMQRVLTHVTKAQAGERGFLLTGNPQLLDTHSDSLSDLEPEIASLQHLTADNAVQTANVAKLRSDVAEVMKDVERVISLHKQGQIEAARRVVFAHETATSIDSIEQTIAVMEQEENRLLKQRTVALETYQQNTNRLLVLLRLLILLSVVLIYVRERATHNKTLTTLESISDAFFSLDKNWNFTYVNGQAEVLLEKKRIQLLGKNVWRMFPGAEEAVFGHYYHLALESKVTQRFDALYPPLDKWFEVAVYPSDKGLSIYFHDITERVITAQEKKHTEEALQIVSERLQLATESGGLGVWEFDFTTNTLTWDEQMLRLYGCAPETFRGAYEEWNARLHPDDKARAEAELGEAIRNGNKFDTEFRIVQPNGVTRYIKADAVVLKDESQIPVRMVGLNQDITERKQADDALKISEERWQLAIKGNDDGIWDWNLITNEVFFSPRWKEMLGYEDHEIPDHLDSWSSRVYPDDLQPAMESIRAYLEGETPLYATEHRMVHKDGSLIWILDRGRALYDENGKPYRMLGSHTDVTQRKQEEEQSRLLATVASESLSGIIITDRDERIVYINPAFEQMTGYSIEEVRGGRPGAMLQGEQTDPVTKTEIREALNAKLPLSVDILNYHRSGKPYWIEMHIAPVFDNKGEVTHFVAIENDITRRKQAEQQLEAANGQLVCQMLLVNEKTTELEEANRRLTTLASTDGLTGLHNHRAFQERLAEEFERTQRYKTSLSVILLDVDKFKLYNDTFGHPEGDVVLKTVSQLLKVTTRDTDYVCRYGGEEFVIILPNTSEQRAREVAERLRATIEDQPWTSRPITASFGVSTLQANLTSVQELIAQTDKAMYASKNKGRNCVTHFTDIALEGVDELAGNISLPYSDIVQEMIQIQQDSFTSASEQMREVLATAYDATILSWSRLLDMKDKETEGHSTRVTQMMIQLAHSIGMNVEETLYARWGALLHDVGKMAVPDHILHKAGSLTEEEWVIMRQHTTIAYEMLSPVAFLRPALDVPYCHHEKWDGTGYPRGLKGEEIPLAARLFAVIDVYDALTSDRPYRKAWSEQETLAHVQSLAGTHFDPRAVKVFLAMMSQKESPVVEEAERLAA